MGYTGQKKWIQLIIGLLHVIWGVGTGKNHFWRFARQKTDFENKKLLKLQKSQEVDL